MLKCVLFDMLIFQQVVNCLKKYYIYAIIVVIMIITFYNFKLVFKRKNKLFYHMTFLQNYL